MSKPPTLTTTPIYPPRPTPPATLILTLPSAHLAPTSFCKCTCGTNSTIIPLDGPLSNHPSRSNNLLLPRLDDRKGWPLFASTESLVPSNSQEAETETPTPTPTPGKDKGKGDSGGGETQDRKEYRAGNCNDCNRQFCLDYMNLPICKGKGAEEIFTTCFRASFALPSLQIPTPAIPPPLANQHDRSRARFPQRRSGSLHLHRRYSRAPELGRHKTLGRAMGGGELRPFSLLPQL